MTEKTYGPYSPYKEADDFIYISGQIGIDPDTARASDDINMQTKQVLKNLKSVLKSARSSIDEVVKTTIYLTNIDDFKSVNALYAEYFGESKPARATVEVSHLPKVGDTKLLIEIEAVAYRGAK